MIFCLHNTALTVKYIFISFKCTFLPMKIPFMNTNKEITCVNILLKGAVFVSEKHGLENVKDHNERLQTHIDRVIRDGRGQKMEVKYFLVLRVSCFELCRWKRSFHVTRTERFLEELHMCS